MLPVPVSFANCPNQKKILSIMLDFLVVLLGKQLHMGMRFSWLAELKEHTHSYEISSAHFDDCVFSAMTLHENMDDV